MRLMVYDATCGVLGKSWWLGGHLYHSLGRLDAWRGVTSWRDGLAWLAEHPRIDEVQFWGHGKWGCAFVDRQALDARALQELHPLHGLLRELRERLQPDALFWFRTCETFGALSGHHFARAWTDWFGRPAAGHTYIIGPWQSGLHSLRPGQAPAWSADEGLEQGTRDAPRRARWSHPWAPNTISCLQGDVPQGY